MSLLDAGGIHSDHPSVIIDSDAMFNEDMFGYSTLRARTAGRTRSGNYIRVLDIYTCIHVSLSAYVPSLSDLMSKNCLIIIFINPCRH